MTTQPPPRQSSWRRAASLGSAVLRLAARPLPDRAIHNALRSLRRRALGRGAYNILGLCSTGHGASAALVSSRHGIRAMNFERYMGRKYALLLAREELREIEHRIGAVGSGIRFMLSQRDGSMPPAAVAEDTLMPFLAALFHGLPIAARDIDIVVSSESHFTFNRAWLGRALGSYFPNAQVHTGLEHHAVHRYQAYYASGLPDAAVITADACGEPLLRHAGSPLAITLSHAHGRDFRVFAEHTFPRSSPGALYAFFNDYLGFDNGEEGKTMGLSSYGRDDCYKILRPHLELNEDGSFRFLNTPMLMGTLIEYGVHRREPRQPITTLHEDVAMAAQLLHDDIMHNAIRALERGSMSRNLCLAGGSALNSVSNERIFRASRFEHIYIMPNAGDCGHALGCALYAERNLVRPVAHGAAAAVTTAGLHRTDALGPHYSATDIESALSAAGLPVHRVDNVAEETAAHIAAGKIVAWFQGGSEFGPRSLGQRSILADPRSPHMKDHLNDRVKHREPFRPFAPAVLEERAPEFFDIGGPSPFMLRVVDVLPAQRDVIPAVTHVDGTARLQTVNAETHPAFHALISAFARITGVPVVLNTSFNVAGRPIVETPADAVDCYLKTAIDVLVLGDFMLVKEPEPVAAQAAATAAGSAS